MADELRRAPLLIAFGLFVLVVLVELGAAAFLQSELDAGEAVERVRRSAEFAELGAAQRDEVLASVEAAARSEDGPPGRGIPYTALIDGIVAYTLGLMVLSLLVPDRLQGKVQGVVTLVLSIVLVIGAIVLALIALVELMLMVSLLFAAPFGTIAYLALWGTFDTGGATAVLTILMVLKLAACVALPVAHQRFLQNKGLVVLLVTSLLCGLLVALLHGVVPFVLVSITDAVAAIVIGVVAAIWGVVLLVGSAVAVVHALATR